MKITSFPLLFLVVAATSIPPAARAESAPIRVVLIGDSTVSNYAAGDTKRGWGQLLQSYFKPDVQVINLAKSGRSTKTFIKEGLWKAALEQKPDWVFIQFGHNDSHDPGKPEATNAATDYKENLRRYVDEARSGGARPILITPMHRRTFDAEGKLNDSLQPYATAMKEVAAEKKVPVIDLHASSGRLLEKIGPSAGPDMAPVPNDFTHFNERGAKAMAELVVAELGTAAPALKSHLK